MTHYQLSFTTRQAMAFFAVALGALVASFFFGLMAGLSGRPAAVAQAAAPSSADAPDAGPTPVSRDAARAVPTDAPAAEIEATPPARLQTFEDAGGEDSAAAESTPAATVSATALSGGVWIQVASLVNRSEADALLARLARRGFPGAIVAANAPKGRVFRVRVGPFSSEGAAQRVAARVRQEARVGQVWIVKEGH